MSGLPGLDPFAHHLGLRLTAPGVVELTVRSDLVNYVGTLLGPVAFALIDYAMTDLVWEHIRPDQIGVTVGIATNFLGTVDAGDVRCSARIDRQGSRIVFTSADVRAVADGRLLATATGSFAIGNGRPTTV